MGCFFIETFCLCKSIDIAQYELENAVKKRILKQNLRKNMQMMHRNKRAIIEITFCAVWPGDPAECRAVCTG